jgi:hypothetical protein
MKSGIEIAQKSLNHETNSLDPKREQGKIGMKPMNENQTFAP